MDSHNSPPWSRNTKVIVTVVALLLLTLSIWQFSSLIRQVVFAAIIAYLLGPVVELVAKRTPLSRGTSILLVYGTAVGLVVWGAISLGVVGVQQFRNLINGLPLLAENVLDLVESITTRSFTVFGRTFSLATDFETFGLELSAILENIANSILQRTGTVVGGAVGVAFSTVNGVTTALFVVIMSIYIAQDAPRIGSMVGDWAHTPGYRDDAERLWVDFGRIWRAYLRGQVILAVVIWLIVWLSLAMAGVNNAFALGVLAGALEFLPIVGPLISTVVAISVALFQPENWMGIPPWQLAIIVGAVMFVIQQVENSVLVPRIVGQALDLPPLLTLLAVFMGTSVAGILGAVLAAPVVATLRLIGDYAWRKMFDQPPFPEKEEEDSAETRSPIAFFFQRLRKPVEALPEHTEAEKEATESHGESL